MTSTLSPVVGPRVHVGPDLRDEPGVASAVAALSVVVALCLCGVVGLPAAPTAVAVVATGAFACRRLAPAEAAVLGVVVWALFTGFVLHRFGELSFGVADLLRLAEFASGTVAAAWLLGRVAPGRGRR